MISNCTVTTPHVFFSESCSFPYVYRKGLSIIYFNPANQTRLKYSKLLQKDIPNRKP